MCRIAKKLEFCLLCHRSCLLTNNTLLTRWTKQSLTTFATAYDGNLFFLVILTSFLFQIYHLHKILVILWQKRIPRCWCPKASIAGDFGSFSDGVVVGQVADGITGQRLSIVAGQQILPITVAVTIGDGVQRRAQCAGGVGVLRLTEDIAAVVVGVDGTYERAEIYSLISLPSQLFIHDYGIF